MGVARHCLHVSLALDVLQEVCDGPRVYMADVAEEASSLTHSGGRVHPDHRRHLPIVFLHFQV